MFTDDWLTLQSLIMASKVEDAELFVKQMHQDYQKHALYHAKIHFAWSKIARLKKAYLISIGQWLTAVFFAIPVSFIQRYF